MELKKLGMAIIMITRPGGDRGMCDEIIVMYAGRVCERGTAEDLLQPQAQYTKGLRAPSPTWR